MRRRNIIGPMITKLRSERGWTQDVLAARLQCHGVNVSRQILANMECGRTQVTGDQLAGFQKVFRVRMIQFFPRAIQELDVKFAELEKFHSSSPRRRR